MGIFDFLRKIGSQSGRGDAPGCGAKSPESGVPTTAEENGKRENQGEVRAAGQDEAPGWDALTEAFERRYPGQTSPRHYAPLVSWRLGGSDPLDGISVYDGGDYWHFLTYGLTELYEKESPNPEVSGYGMEFTLKLKKTGKDADSEEAEIRGVCGILQSVARLTFQKGEMFLPYEYLYTGQKKGMDAAQRSGITGFLTIPDREIDPVSTPNGSVEFVQFVGVTDAEVGAVYRKELTVKELYEKLGTDLTDYDRSSVI